MGPHAVHVTGWDGFSASLELRCDRGPGAPCFVVTDEAGENPDPVEYCNVKAWFDNCDPEDLIHGTLQGEPPWPVAVTWTDDGPELRAVDNSQDGEA